jgi:hypothetical protein
MKLLKAGAFLLICILFCVNGIKANHLTDSLPNVLHTRPDALFVHTDKHVYTNNEFIWFSAVLLNVASEVRPLHNLLCMVLIPADTRIPAVYQKFLMADGLSYGSVKLPDSIAPGEYKLVAYTNLIGKDSLPAAVFMQDITVHSITESNFIGACTIMEDAKGNQDLLITVRDKTTSAPVREAELLLWRGNSKMIKAKTDKDGICRQSLQQLQPSNASSVINVRIKYQDGLQYVQKILPAKEKDRTLAVHFYPEGGQLLSGVPCQIGWQSATDQGEPVGVKAVVYKNQTATDTIVTNEWGMGSFQLLPDAGAAYSVKVLNAPPGVGINSTGYTLPAVLNKGVNMRLQQGVANDSLRLRMYAAGYSTLRLAVHNFKTLFFEQTIPVHNPHTPVLLLLDSIPKGLAAVTILDEQDKPIAQRIFFAHYDNKAVVDIQPDQSTYKKRQKVTLTLRLTNKQQPDSGFAMISCVQANRVLNNRQQDIESFNFLEAPLQEGALLNRRYNNMTWLENLLLNSTGRKYTVQPDPPVFFSPAITGKVEASLGKIKKPVNVTVLGNQAGASVITTNASGHFEFKYDDLLVLQDKKLLISANVNKYTSNSVSIQDPFAALNRRLASVIDFRSIDAAKYAAYAQTIFVKEFGQSKQLATVTVTAKYSRDASIHKTVNECGDYICVFGYLNCRNHPLDPGNHAPVKGTRFRMNGGGFGIYAGCVVQADKKERALHYDGINIGAAFHPEDFSQKTGNSPEYLSTLYFSPVLVFDANGKAECSFYTSDITGRFRIAVNGMTHNNLFSATAYIEVK